MIPRAIESYAQHCNYKRAAHAVDDRPDFKLYVVEGVAYAQPINARARDFLLGFDENYIPWKPIVLTAYDLGVFTDMLHEGKLKLTMETITI